MKFRPDPTLPYPILIGYVRIWGRRGPGEPQARGPRRGVPPLASLLVGPPLYPPHVTTVKRRRRHCGVSLPARAPTSSSLGPFAKRGGPTCLLLGLFLLSRSGPPSSFPLSGFFRGGGGTASLGSIRKAETEIERNDEVRRTGLRTRRSPDTDRVPERQIVNDARNRPPTLSLSRREVEMDLRRSGARCLRPQARGDRTQHTLINPWRDRTDMT